MKIQTSTDTQNSKQMSTRTGKHTGKKTRKDSGKGKKQDIYARVTDCILKQLEKGVIPWQSPHFAKTGFPQNFNSGRDYQGCNILLLGMCGYVSPYFLTYRQAQERGGQVRKGEKGHLVIKYGEYAKKETDPATGDKSETFRGYLKGFTLFNACQIDGIDFPEVKLPEFTPSQQVDKAQEIVSKMPSPPEIREGRGVKTCYNIQTDIVDVPSREFFESEERYFKSLFHELCHSTGASKRLARKTLVENKGMMLSDSGIYSREELVAEIGAAFLCAHAGIVMDEHENSSAYLASWLKVLKVKGNHRWIVEAAAQAQKAVHYILGTSPH